LFVFARLTRSHRRRLVENADRKILGRKMKEYYIEHKFEARSPRHFSALNFSVSLLRAW